MKILTLGVFDLLHSAHIKMLSECKHYNNQENHLTVGIQKDVAVFKFKDKFPIYEENERLYIISNLKCVDHVFLYDSNFDFNNLTIDLFIHGPDISITTYNLIKNQLNVPMVCMERHTNVLYATISSSLIRSKLDNYPNIGIDFHDTITYNPNFFKLLLNIVPNTNIFIVTGTPKSEIQNIVHELENIGIEKSMYNQILMGFEYSVQNMNIDHFYKMQTHKINLLRKHNIKVYFDDNPYYVNMAKECDDILVFQTVLSKSYMNKYKEKHPFFTGHLQEEQFKFLK